MLSKYVNHINYPNTYAGYDMFNEDGFLWVLLSHCNAMEIPLKYQVIALIIIQYFERILLDSTHIFKADTFQNQLV